MDEETLNRLAAEALIEEAKVGARRAEIMGPSGWVKPKETINKRFLRSTLRNAILSNRHKQRSKEKRCETSSHKDSSSKNDERSRSKRRE
ncbi:protein POLR1D [Diachasma alloeum]|uniref:protein POLR1D n=1 Tax=Diachasma alloeum TaxID=454923 RepID=UPI000738306B|nr:protein POLR1D [Diachasma alloeum]